MSSRTDPPPSHPGAQDDNAASSLHLWNGAALPVPSTAHDPIPGRTVLHWNWKAGVAFDGHRIESPKSPELVREVYNRAIAPRTSEAWLLEGDVRIDGDTCRVFLDDTHVAPPRDTATELGHHVRNRSTPGIPRPPTSRQIESAIFLQHPWDCAFFPAFHILYPRLLLAEELGVAKDVPILINCRFADHAMTRRMRETPLFSEREIVVQDFAETIFCNRLYVLDPFRYHRPYWDALSDAMPKKEPQAAIGDKLVLIRAQKVTSQRVTAGYDALVSLLEARGYDRVDPASLDLFEQKSVFSRARHIVAENGGALTNMCHRRNGPLRIDSLIASTYQTSTFQTLAGLYGHDFNSHVLRSKKTADGIEMQLDQDTVESVLSSAGAIE